MFERIVLAIPLVSSSAAAEVTKASPAGFESRHVVTIAAPADRVWAVLVAPARWWSKEHSYSGDAANLSLDPRAGGCWCERLKDGGSVEHMRVGYIEPRKALRLIGGLGPLQAEGAQGALTITLGPAADGTTKVTFSYVVGGYIRAGTEVMAPRVDMVIGQQVQRLKAEAEAK